MVQKIFNKNQVQELAEDLARYAKIGDVFGLKGTLGAGKSFFSKYFINALLKEKTEVLSPTFNLLYSYQTPKGTVHHFDLYRIKNIEELEDIGFFECLKDGICLVEWPEIAESFFKKNYTQIDINIHSENERKIVVKKL